MILLQLGLLAPETDTCRWQYLEACVAAAYQRAQLADTPVLLARSRGDPRLRRIGVGCLAAVDTIR
ncbi:MAG: hypothetical protein GY796_26295 [Chloroflexi bacterium]|nr:hypothetical protein [Chloroflexota bacterium]